MAYEKQTWVDNETIVDAARMEHIEAGIFAAEKLAEEKITNPATGAVGQILEVETVDENGKPLTFKAVDKSASGESERVTLVEKEERPFALYNYFGKYGYGFETEPFIPVVGEEYIVVWGTDEFTCTAQEAVMGGSTGIGFGNASVLGLGEDTGEPFCLMYGNGMFVIFSAEDTEASSHAFGIYQDMSNELPEVSAEDNGKFLQVVNGKWAAVTVINGNEVAY